MSDTMSTDPTDGSASARGSHPRQDERLPSLTTSDTTTDGDTTDHEAEDEEELKNEMKLLWAERQIIDLKLKFHRVDVENRGLKAKVTELEANSIANAPTVPDTTDLLRQHEALAKAIEERQLELRMNELSLRTAEEAAQQADRMRADRQNLQVTNARLANELNNVRLKLDEAKARANDANYNRALVVELQARNTALEAKIEQLADKNDQLTAMHFAGLEAMKKNSADLSFYRAKNENNEHELKALREKVVAAETDRDWHRSEHTKILEVRNALNAERGHDSPQVGRLKGDIAMLRNEKKELQKQNKSLKFQVAYYITEFDLADANLRVFTCGHKSTNDIPDGQNATREKTASLIATEFFRCVGNDDEFIKEYNAVRQYFLAHHRAHENANQGRGDLSWKLKNTMLQVDTRRGINITYS